MGNPIDCWTDSRDHRVDSILSAMAELTPDCLLEVMAHWVILGVAGLTPDCMWEILGGSEGG